MDGMQNVNYIRYEYLFGPLPSTFYLMSVPLYHPAGLSSHASYRKRVPVTEENANSITSR